MEVVKILDEINGGSGNFCHKPVLLDFFLEKVLKESDEWFLDGTLGEGGHAHAFLLKGLKGVGVDRDSSILEVAVKRLDCFISEKLFFPFCANFSKAKAFLNEASFYFDFILLDLGISRYHYFYSGKGFSFQKEEPLDMRLDMRLEGEKEKKIYEEKPISSIKKQKSAGELVNGAKESELADIFYYYGELRNARKLAACIVQERKKAPIDTAKKLADLVAKNSFYNKNTKIHPATQVFQALRIYVNSELDHLTEGIRELVSFLRPQGRLAVISYHSLEDRIVKKTFGEYIEKRQSHNKYRTAKKEQSSSENDQKNSGMFELFNKKVIRSACEEVWDNPAARSAKLRILVKNK